uniref:Uncharacterized protein n=1 Tax=Arundo donax TaxID=35708 RepID=A0A0A9CM21_ARUDO
MRHPSTNGQNPIPQSLRASGAALVSAENYC